jgi:uncharacterized membrane protein
MVESSGNRAHRVNGQRRALWALCRQPVARDTNVAFERGLTPGQRVADWVAAFGGSWPFILLFLMFLAVWIVFNADASKPFDPYPYILLNLILSCIAALQAPVIMMSQNRQAAKDRLDAQQDYEVNLKAEMAVMALHEKLDDLRDRRIAALEQLVARQAELLEGLGARFERAAAPNDTRETS